MLPDPTGRRGGSAVRIVSVLPDVLGTYGDGGNVRVLQQRLSWRGIDCVVLPVTLGQSVPDTGDIYVLGGGEDLAQTAAARSLGRSGGLQRAVAGGAVVFAVCAGFQVLGEWFLDGMGQRADGLGLLDARTDRLPRRAVGEVRARPGAFPDLPPLTGFENHGGRTMLGPDARPFAEVSAGVGNGDDAAAGAEGAVSGRVIATYLHGPVLARNPALADLLLSTVAGTLEPLDDSMVERLRAERLGAGRP